MCQILGEVPGRQFLDEEASCLTLSCPNRWATAPELSSSCRCTTRASSPPWMRAFNQTRVKSPLSAARSDRTFSTVWFHFVNGTRFPDRNFLLQAVSLLEEVITPRKELPPLLLKLNERRAEKLDYLGVSYGLTAQLLRSVQHRGGGLDHLRVTC